MSDSVREARLSANHLHRLQSVTATSIEVGIKSKQRVLPEAFNREARPPVRQRLSIIDASVANFSPTGALWFFDGPEENEHLGEKSQPQGKNIFDLEDLRRSLALTLNAYPHFAGRLRLVHDEDKLGANGGCPRCNRVEICFDDAKSPGVELIMATTDARLDQMIPRLRIQADNGAWLATDIPKEQVFCQGNVANVLIAPSCDESFSDASGSEPQAPNNSLKSCMVVQVTYLGCGGIIVGVKVSHPLADANTLGFLMQEWSRSHQALVRDLTRPISKAIFDPSLLDAAAMRASETTTPHELLGKAMSIPAHRYDWWDQAGAKFESPAAIVPEILKGCRETEGPLANGQKMPWDEWDNLAKVEHVVLRYSSAQLAALRKAVQDKQKPDIRMPSTLDILLAHVWSAINRARGYSPEKEDGQVHADVTVGLRKRIDPPLPDGFVGSPLSQMTVSISAHEACSADAVATMANQIRKTNSIMTPELVAAHIYGVMQELTPQRVWQVFLGRRHLLVTSWAHTGVYNVNFGGEQGPRYVHGIMPAIDGCVQIIEGVPLDRPNTEGGSWYDDGINVNVYLEAAAMARLLDDPELHP